MVVLHLLLAVTNENDRHKILGFDSSSGLERGGHLEETSRAALLGSHLSRWADAIVDATVQRCGRQ
jgi:hypothetical protein